MQGVLGATYDIMHDALLVLNTSCSKPKKAVCVWGGGGIAMHPACDGCNNTRIGLWGSDTLGYCR